MPYGERCPAAIRAGLFGSAPSLKLVDGLERGDVGIHERVRRDHQPRVTVQREPCFAALGHLEPAVDGDDGPGDVAGVVVEEKGHCTGDFRGLAEAPDRNPIDDTPQ